MPSSKKQAVRDRTTNVMASLLIDFHHSLLGQEPNGQSARVAWCAEQLTLLVDLVRIECTGDDSTLDAVLIRNQRRLAEFTAAIVEAERMRTDAELLKQLTRVMVQDAAQRHVEELASKVADPKLVTQLQLGVAAVTATATVQMTQQQHLDLALRALRESLKD